MRGLFFSVIALGLACSPARSQYVPSWWLDSSNPVLTPGVESRNFAIANTAQLKWIATRAKAHLDATLPGGAGTAIDNLVAGFKPQAGVSYTQAELDQIHRDNFAPATLGQVKAVAVAFYDRLWNLSPRYDTNLNLKANGYPQTWTSKYPWNDPAVPVSENYKPATVGQLKLVFSFDIVDSNQNGTFDYLEGIYPAASDTRDTDGDGVPDAQDAFPNDPTRTVQLVNDPNDHIPPTITLTNPTGAVLTP